MNYRNAFLMCSFTISSFSAQAQSSFIPEKQLAPETVLMGTATSIVLGSIIGILMGEFNKSISEELRKRNYKKLAWSMAWLLNPTHRVGLINYLSYTIEQRGVPMNVELMQFLAKTFDWLIYFEKISFLPSNHVEKQKPIVNAV